MCKKPFPYYSQCIAVSNRKLCPETYLKQVEKVCALHPKAFILREKDLSELEYEQLARKVIDLTRKYQVECILHSYSEAAVRLGQGKLHLPLAKFLEWKEEEERKFQKIGVSIHSVEEAVLAERAGAAYLTAGHIFATTCKPDLAPRGLSFLEEVCRSVHVPVYAIGGIQFDEKQWEKLFACHAAGGCIMSGFMQCD